MPVVRRFSSPGLRSFRLLLPRAMLRRGMRPRLRPRRAFSGLNRSFPVSPSPRDTIGALGCL